MLHHRSLSRKPTQRDLKRENNAFPSQAHRKQVPKTGANERMLSVQPSLGGPGAGVPRGHRYDPHPPSSSCLHRVQMEETAASHKNSPEEERQKFSLARLALPVYSSELAQRGGWGGGGAVLERGLIRYWVFKGAICDIQARKGEADKKKRKGEVYHWVSSTEEATPSPPPLPPPAPLPPTNCRNCWARGKKNGWTWCTDPTCVIRAEEKSASTTSTT